MLTYILESSACLAIFLCFYKLLLEKENTHVFKRFYLLFSIALAFGIPLLTFTQYIETSTEILPSIIQNSSLQTSTLFETNPTTHDNYVQVILWGIYGLGVLISGMLFFKSLIQILFNIKNNTRLEKDHFTIVLLSNVITPHTFFNYIFLNRNKFETQQIPQEVLLHEKTHALQKHSWDILCVEILQVIFWFNPLMYILKHDIKLNHEFLADQAVLSKGINASTYQKMLLAFSSNAQQPQLANAINYSIIKKRFVIMKKHTSKKTVWLRSMFLLPILSFLLFSFSTEVIIVEKKANILESQEALFLEKKATQEQIDEYNTLAKKYNTQPRSERVFKPEDLKRMTYIYGLMNTVQKRTIEPFPLHPLKTEKRTFQKQTTGNNVSLVNKKIVESSDLGKVKAETRGKIVNQLVNQIGNTTVVPPDIDVNISNDVNVDISVPKGFATSAITELSNNGAIFDYNGKQISSERAIAIAENTDFVAQRDLDSKKLIVYLSESTPSKRQIKKWSKKY